MTQIGTAGNAERCRLRPEGPITKKFDGAGRSSDIDADSFAGLALPAGAAGFFWQHLQLSDEKSAARLAAAGLDQFVIDALTADETRPRCTIHGDGVLLNLRGVNPRPEAEPGDMVSIRFWIEGQRIVGTSIRPLEALTDLLAAIDRGLGPHTPGDLVAKLALRLADRTEPEVAELNDRIDDIEERSLDSRNHVTRAELAEVRRSSIMLRRYLVPQKDALTTLEIEDLSWLRERDRAHLREAAERFDRLGEELDAIRDRAQVVHDQILDHRAESLNRRMLLLSVVAAVFLPLNLVTSLLGINVAGIPGADNPAAFLIVCGLLVGLGVAVYLFFRLSGMLR